MTPHATPPAVTPSQFAPLVAGFSPQPCGRLFARSRARGRGCGALALALAAATWTIRVEIEGIDRPGRSHPSRPREV